MRAHNWKGDLREGVQRKAFPRALKEQNWTSGPFPETCPFPAAKFAAIKNLFRLLVILQPAALALLV